MINRFIRSLIISDFLFNFAFGLLGPVFAVFAMGVIDGATLQVVGLGVTFYWIARILSTVPLSRLMDHTDGERDEYYFMITGMFIIATLPLFYLVMHQPWHLYAIQFVNGFSHSMMLPAWRILFTDHIDQGKTGYEWSLDDVGVGAAAAISAYIGSMIANRYGFEIVIVMLSVISYIATFLLIPIWREAKTLSQFSEGNILKAIRERRRSRLSFNPFKRHN